MPARALKRVVLPVFGLPTRATVGVMRRVMGIEDRRSRIEDRGSKIEGQNPSILDPRSSILGGKEDARRFAAAQTQAVVAQADLHRVAERSEAEHLDLFALEQAHLQKALHNRVVTLERRDPGSFAGS